MASRGKEIGVRPRGVAWPVSDAWKRETLADMDRAGISVPEMADRIACAPTSLYGLFSGTTRASRLVPRIHVVLGKPAPGAPLLASADPQLAGIGESWPLLSQEERDHVCSFVDQRAAARRAGGVR